MANALINKVRISEGREISEMTSIETISLPSNGMDEFPLVKYSGLVRLYLQENNLSDIIDLTGCTNLQYFSIKNNIGIVDIGIGDTSEFSNVRYFEATGASLSESTVGHVLEALDSSGISGGLCYLDGGNNAAPSVGAQVYVSSLQAKSWDVRVN
jgi:Leucine-rich repeat (LRR) protein